MKMENDKQYIYDSRFGKLFKREVVSGGIGCLNVEVPVGNNESRTMFLFSSYYENFEQLRDKEIEYLEQSIIGHKAKVKEFEEMLEEMHQATEEDVTVINYKNPWDDFPDC